MSPSHHRERGSVIFYILIAIVAFAALSIAVSRSGRESAGTIDKEKSDLATTEIFDYSNALRSAVQNMMIQGTQQNQLCFDHNAWGNANFVYPACSTPKNKVFAVAGGNAPVQRNVSKGLLDNAYVDSLPLAGVWYFTGNMRIKGVGQDCDPNEDCNDLVAVLLAVKKNVCIALNKKLGMDDAVNLPPVNLTGMTLTPYVGAYTYDANSIVSVAALTGKRSGCFKDGSGPYVFYAVLAAN